MTGHFRTGKKKNSTPFYRQKVKLVPHNFAESKTVYGRASVHFKDKKREGVMGGGRNHVLWGTWGKKDKREEDEWAGKTSFLRKGSEKKRKMGRKKNYV